MNIISLKSYDTDRQRIIAALEYFDEKRWIDLQAIDVYDIMNQAFDMDKITEKMHNLFRGFPVSVFFKAIPLGMLKAGLWVLKSTPI